MIKIPHLITGKDELPEEEGYDPNSLVLDQFVGYHDFDKYYYTELAEADQQRQEQPDVLEVIQSRKDKRKHKFERRLENLKRTESET